MGSLSKISAALAITTMLTATPASSQYYSGAVGTVNTGYMSARQLTSSVREASSDSISIKNGYTLLGAEGYYLRDKMILSLSGYIAVQSFQADDTDLVEPFLWTSHAALGWTIFRKNNLFVYPTLGAGVTGFSITRYHNSAETVADVAKVLPASMEFAIHLDYLMTDPYSEGRIVNGIVFGLKAGYHRAVTTGHWHYSNGQTGVAIRPSQLQGWYVTISVGGLAFLKKTKT